MNRYIGHASQLYGIEEHRLVGGKGDGMRLFEVHNGKGLDLTVSPEYYDNKGTNWLSSFTAGFLTTCGLNGVGTPCVDNGEEIPLHGSISNTPCEKAYFLEETENNSGAIYLAR
ncbi:MAG: DUF4432 family protein [Lachnospiraceae bacterium]|nr:DUF4432 family protein [Lachnospiraceae bacterium]